MYTQSTRAAAPRSLLAMTEAETRAHGLSRLVMVTSNDDLPALYLYQRWGFMITEVKPGAILAHHGREEPGFAHIPVRDEIRLERRLSSCPASRCAILELGVAINLGDIGGPHSPPGPSFPPLPLAPLGG